MTNRSIVLYRKELADQEAKDGNTLTFLTVTGLASIYAAARHEEAVAQEGNEFVF